MSSEDHSTATAENGTSEFEALSSQKEPGLVAEFIQFVATNKKWWMIPILLVLGLVGLFAVLGSTGGAPFIYTLF